MFRVAAGFAGGGEAPAREVGTGPGDGEAPAVLALEVFELDGQAALTQADGGFAFHAFAVDAVVEDDFLAVEREARAVVAVEEEGVLAGLGNDEIALEDEAEGCVARAEADVEEARGHGAGGLGFDEREVRELVPCVAVVAELQVVEVGVSSGVGLGFACGVAGAEGFLDLGDRGLEFVAAGVEFAGALVGGLLLRGGGEERDFVGGAAVAVMVHVLEEREQAVVIALRDGIDLVIVAAGAIDGEAEEDLAGGGDEVVEAVVAGEFAVGGFVVPDAEPIEAGSGDRFGVSVGEFVAGELFAEEAVVGLVGIEGADHVIAVAPGVGFGIVAFVTVALGEAHEVEPVAAPLLAVSRGFEQTVDDGFKGARGTVALEGGHFFGRRRETGEIVGRATEPLVARRGGIGGELLGVEAGADESVDRVGGRVISN